MAARPLAPAKYMNDLIYNDDLFTPGSKTAKENPRLGIVVMDFVNKQLCRRIIDRNAFPSSAAMKVGTVTADGETQTAEQTPFLVGFRRNAALGWAYVHARSHGKRVRSAWFPWKMRLLLRKT